MTTLTLDVPVFAQREAECGNTSLKAVCWFHGHRYSAKYLGRLAQLTSDGIDHGSLVAAARRTGAQVTQASGGTIAQLRAALAQGLPPIIGWWSLDEGDSPFDPGWSLRERRARDCGHYSVVCGVDADRVQLMDPQWGDRRGSYGVIGRRWMSNDEFLRVWYDTDTAAYRPVKRWFMVVQYR